MSRDSKFSNGDSSQSSAIEKPIVVREILDGQADYAQMTDCELLKTFVDKQLNQAMAEFVSRHSNKVIAVCRTINADRNDADDAYQATFLAAVMNAKKLENVDSHGGWLCRVAYNASLKVKKSKLRMVSTNSIGLDSKPDPVPETWQIIEMRESVGQLLNELLRLPRDYQDCLLLAYFEELSRSEIALRMGKSESSVKALLQRGKKLLRSRLLRRGAVSMVAFAGIGLSVSAANANVLMTSTIQNCLIWFQEGSATISSSVLKLSETASSVVRSQLAYAQVGALAVGILAIGLAGLTGSTVPIGNRHSNELALSNTSIDERLAYQFVLQEPIVDNKATLIQSAATLESEINNDKARLKTLAEWTHHKHKFINESTDEQEVSMLKQIVDELELESNEIQDRLVSNEFLMKRIKSKLDDQ